MFPRDAEATRARLLAAAKTEFATHGIAGARVDRIADAAGANKAQIYHYFESKDGLFDAVFGGSAEQSLEGGYFDAENLPETAGRIFDQFAGDPELARLTAWYRLERSGTPDSIAAVATANARKIDAIRAAQRSGIISDRLPADVLLVLILTPSTAWGSIPPEFAEPLAEFSTAQRRAFTVDAVARLVDPN